MKKLVLIVCVFLMGCAGASEEAVVSVTETAVSPSPQPPTPTLEPVPPLEEKLGAHFPFNGDAADATGNGNDGTVEGATLAADRFGNPDSAYNFDGSDDFITIPHDTSYAPTGSFTLSAWYYFEPQETPTWYSIIEKTDPEREGHSRWGFWVIRDRAEFCIQPASTSTHICLDSTQPLIENGWNHIVGTWGTKSIALYLNGDLSLAEEHPIDSISFSNYDMVLGTDPYNQPNPVFLKGKIDDIRLYRRTLDETEILDLFALESEGME